MGIKTEEPIVIGSFQFTFAYFLRKVLTDRQRYTVNKIIIIIKKKTATTTTTTLERKLPRQLIDQVMCFENYV